MWRGVYLFTTRFTGEECTNDYLLPNSGLALLVTFHPGLRHWLGTFCKCFSGGDALPGISWMAHRKTGME